MLLRVVAAGFVVVATAATARAQAPGDTEGQPIMPPGYVQPTAAPPAAAPCAWSGAHEPVMANRWAIGLSVGHLAIAPKDAPDTADKAEFGVGELSLRFRATLHLELEVALGGGRQTLKDGTDGELEAHTGMIAARYRFSPEHEWNWWLMGGLGGMQVAPHGSTDQQFKDTERPMGQLGIGIERRFARFALQAELRAVNVGPPKNNDQIMPVSGGIAPGQTTQPQQPPQPTNMASDQLSGGLLSIGASYYF
jgi:hypothetical protein